MHNNLTTSQILDKMAKYCAYQERCSRDVKTKLREFDLSEEIENEILEYLIDNKFIDDNRFAKAFVRGKINQNGWGANKIRYSLIQKGIDKDTINAAMADIDDTEYRDKLTRILRNKKVHADSKSEAMQKIAAYAIRKGFEPSIVWDTIKDIDIF